ncbi:MAG TPA: CpsD/CapB family tyrosine-protein kinase [Woeseiaceae bacterium]|nr:CpsD/CapB family tyrosine-protein kinase [Woeseiaceae bacterium]
MTSIIQKVLEAEKRRHAATGSARDRDPERRTFGQVTKEFVAATGLFKRLATRVESKAMERNKILPAVDDQSAVTAYKILRTRVLQRLRSNGWRSLIVTGAGAGEGKTLTACNLAVSVSNDVNQAVVLVDLDLQRSTVASYFGLDIRASMGDYLLGHAQIDDIVYAPAGLERLVIVPNREPVPNSSDLLASPRMRTFLQWLQEQGPETIVIFDMPPVLACDDVLAFSPYADAILLVVAEGKTERAALGRTMELLGERNLLGVVLNQSREKGSVSPYYY